MYGELSTHLRVEAFVDALSLHGISGPWLFTAQHACFFLEQQALCFVEVESPTGLSLFDSLWIQHCNRDLCRVSLA